MALRSTGASDPDLDGSPVSRRPIRTCVGCRQRAEATELLRVAVAPSSPNLVIPDMRRRVPGRGAWVHSRVECVELAERRRAFVRALRTPGPVDASAVREFLVRNQAREQATGDTATPTAEPRRS